MSRTFERIKESIRNFPNVFSGGTEYLTIDMHTCGEPLRVILSGVPVLEGDSILAKRKELQEKHDQLRKLLMYEPRGHSDMYGCVLVEPENVDSDFGIIFMHNDGYSTMCGHAIIAITKLAATLGWKEVEEGGMTLRIDAPCGLVESTIDMQVSGEFPIRFTGVPSFVYLEDQVIELPGYGAVAFDICYGGAFYAYVDADQMGLDLIPANISNIVKAGKDLKLLITHQGITVRHPTEADLSFLYGVIFRSAANAGDSDFLNVCVFADGEVDRSPTGSGVCGKLALLYHKQLINSEKELVIESIIRTRFKGQVLNHISWSGLDAVVPAVSGNAFISGVHRFFLDPDDPLSTGFLIR